MTDELTQQRGTPSADPFPVDGAPESAPHARVRPPRRRRGGRWVGAVVLVLALVGLVLLAPWDPQRRQAYADQFTVWTEPPSAQVEQLAEELQLTEDGRRVFFATRPQVETARDFEEHCPFEAEIVLGCYDSGRIYVYEVSDERLAGTVEATAAHELLHAVYERMSESDARRVDELVAGYVATLPEDDENVTIVAGYPAAQRADEWHSRLGTSYTDLPAELEAHYATVFADRSRVLAFDDGSREALEEYTARIDQLSAELDAASAELAQRASDYDATLATLDADVTAFNARAAAGDFSSQSQFDSERAAIIARQDALEAERLALNADVDAYNAKLAELQSLDSERADLYSQLDSRQAP
ncbi:hypothetical protein [Protaetiibacter intestinalis]|uniref:Uncharacterized protein n=1 Tax=Protaetiibacter intestinalis TaxID=2419774 RepID=A0A387B577_9MICO|nr:hypothetical protein [Protaetiibacter intestinalis]AYF98844.1 hypothetical protein D7I47_11665 [Protaetiibacter intestinalis]